MQTIRWGALGATWLMVVVGCAESPAEPRVISAMRAPVPGLMELAADVRSRGGWVVVGEVTELSELEPETAALPTTDEVLVQYPLSRAQIAVIDSLGEEMGPLVSVVGLSGPERLVHEDGTPAEGWVLSDAPPAQTMLPAPGAGARVFFVFAHDGEMRLSWVAPVAGELALGEGTSAPEGDVALGALTRALACEAEPRYPIRGAGAPIATPAITASVDSFEGSASIVSATLAGDELTLELSVDGSMVTITVPDADGVPAIATGDLVDVSWERASAPFQRTRLALSDEDGLIAAYVRAGGFGAIDEELAWLTTQSGVSLTHALRCRSAAPGQCGRQVVSHEVVVAPTDARVGEGATAMLTDDLDLRVAALADDSDPWAGAGCAIGLEVSVVLDVLRR